MMNETTCCQDYCYNKIYSKVEDIEPLINYVYDIKDCKVDSMFGGQHFSFKCKDFVLYYECPSVHRIRYFCRLINVCRICSTHRNNIAHKICIYVVMFNLLHGFHLTFRISIDITAKQYTNGIGIPLINIEEIECLGLLLLFRDNLSERLINETKENILYLYSILLDNYGQDVYKTQQCCFSKGIYCPLRLISLHKFYYSYRLLIFNAILRNCTCKNYLVLCKCFVNMHYNRMLVNSMNE